MNKSFKIVEYDNEIHRDQVIDLWSNIFGYESWHNEPGLVIDKKINITDNLFFVTINGDCVTGTIMAGWDGHRGWLYSLAVLPQYRCQGIGSALVKYAEQQLIERGCIKINLQVVESNQNVIAFYKELGYLVEKRISMGKLIDQ